MQTIPEIKPTKAQLQTIAQMTDDNQHGEVLQYIAKIVGHKQYETIFKLINQLHNIEGSMPTDLREYRNRNRNELFTYIVSDKGQTYFNLIYSNL